MPDKDRDRAEDKDGYAEHDGRVVVPCIYPTSAYMIFHQLNSKKNGGERISMCGVARNIHYITLNSRCRSRVV